MIGFFATIKCLFETVVEGRKMRVDKQVQKYLSEYRR